MPKRVFVTDCEGPISKNDNAFELASKFIPDGDKLFTVVSKYDDIQADIVKRSGYKAGDTLKLILPFFKAYDVTDEMMEEYSSENILLVPGAKKSLEQINSFMSSYIISTSYEHYIRSLCEKIDFPFENTYSTRLRINDYEINETEKTRLQEIAEEIIKMPVMEIPESNLLQDFSSDDKRNIKRLDEIFFKEIPQMKIGKILNEVNPVGGFEKEKALADIVEKLDINKRDVMYVGDSITDVQCFQMIRNTGLPVSFNGNSYAIREAEIAVLSTNTMIIPILAGIFNEYGREGVIKSVVEWNKFLEKINVQQNPNYIPQVEVIDSFNMKRLSKESSIFRKTIRGEAIGKLG
ncbi:MAG: HAD hydrolase family protein [Candidatus Heimdallarchaeaceae archaeon]